MSWVSRRPCSGHDRRSWEWVGGPSVEGGARRVCDGGNGPCLGVPWPVEVGAAAGVSGGRGQCLSHAVMSRCTQQERCGGLGWGQAEGVIWGSLAQRWGPRWNWWCWVERLRVCGTDQRGLEGAGRAGWALRPEPGLPAWAAGREGGLVGPRRAEAFPGALLAEGVEQARLGQEEPREGSYF